MLKKTEMELLKFNPYTMIRNDWWVVTAGTPQDGFNGMTASWGMLGSLWGKPHAHSGHGLPVAQIFIRPQRYTRELLDTCEYFTLSVLKPEYHSAHKVMGSESGRHQDKIAKAGLHLITVGPSAAYEEAECVFVCRKLLQTTLTQEDFCDPEIDRFNYPAKDYHKLYIGEIVEAYVDPDYSDKYFRS